jgi:hypothetical protein
MQRAERGRLPLTAIREFWDRVREDKKIAEGRARHR